MVIAGDEPGGRSLRDLILASMALDEHGKEPLTIEHEPGSPVVGPPQIRRPH
jgi:hypothetical protein